MNTFALGRLLSRYSHAFDVFGFHLQRLAAHGLQTGQEQCAAKSGQGTVSLAPMELWRCDTEPGRVIECRTGAVWITQTGDATDYILRSGQTWEARRHGRIIVQAMAQSSIRVEGRDAGE